MKTKEFIEEMESVGLFVIPNTKHENVYVEMNGQTIAIIKNNEQYNLTTKFTHIADFDDYLKDTIYSVLVRYAQTPLAEREEEKRYYLQSMSPLLRKNECGHLLYHKSMGRYFTGSAEYGGDVYQAIFTESEIAEMDITGFEKIEVTE